MRSKLSKSHIDRLGQRLKDGNISEDDISHLDEYRRSFGKAYEIVDEIIRQKLNLNPTGRPAKSTSSVIEKLQRETIRLTQIQDIAGCRIILPNIDEQNKTIESIIHLFPKARVIDRRKNPSHGYRAVHIIPDIEGKPIEIQIRTDLQHLWAERSEKLADMVDPAIKYGGGPEEIRKLIIRIANYFEKLEYIEQGHILQNITEADRSIAKQELASLKSEMLKVLDEFITAFESKGDK